MRRSREYYYLLYRDLFVLYDLPNRISEPYAAEMSQHMLAGYMQETANSAMLKSCQVINLVGSIRPFDWRSQIFTSSGSNGPWKYQCS